MNNTDFDIVIFGSGFSCRYLVSKLTDCRKILILTSEKQSLNKYGINHKDGNSFIQHNIRISKDDQNILNENVHFKKKEYNISLKTFGNKIKKINKLRHKIIIKKIAINDISIDQFENKFYKIYINKFFKKTIISTKLIFFATSYSTKDIILDTKINGKKIFKKEIIKTGDNFSTIFKINKEIYQKINLEKSNSKKKSARFVLLNKETSFHYYIKKYSFLKFEQEWNVTFALSLLKKGYLIFFLLKIINSPQLIFLIPLRFILPKKYFLYISLESFSKKPKKEQVSKIFNYFVDKDYIDKKNYLSFRDSLNDFVSNSHFHSNIPSKLCDSIYVIGSASVERTFSANPTGFIINQIDKLLKDVEEKLNN